MVPDVNDKLLGGREHELYELADVNLIVSVGIRQIKGGSRLLTCKFL